MHNEKFIIYWTSCASKFILKSKDESTEKRHPIFPVNKVMILYPKSKYDFINLDEVEDYKLKFIKVKPGKNLELLEEELKEEIEAIIEKERLL